MWYKKWGLIFAAFNMGLFFSSCGGKTNIINVKPNNELQGDISLWSDESSLKALQNAEDKYKKMQPNVKINIENLGSNDSIIDKISKTTTLVSDRPDAAVIDEESLPLLMNTYPNDFEDLTKTFSEGKDNFTQNSIYGVTYKDKIRAYPWYDDPVGIFYRKDIMSKYSVNIDDIKTWDDFAKAGETISKASSGRIKMLDFNISSDDMFKILLNQLGGTYRNKNDNCILNGEKPTRVMYLLKQLEDTGVIKDVNDNNKIWNEVKAGTSASIILPVQSVPEIINSFPELKGMLQMSSLPSFDIGGNKSASFGGKAIVIFKNTKYDKVINEFANYTVSDKDLAINNLKKNNIFTGFTPAYKDNYFEAKDDFFNNQKILKLFSSINNDAYSIGFTYDSINLDKNIIDAQKKILGGSDILTTMQQLVDKSSTN